jgi:ABC-2 type transport system permease protein
VIVPDGYGAALSGSQPVQVRFLGTTQSLTQGLRAPVEAVIARQSAIVMAARTSAGLGAGSYDAAATVAASAYGSVPGVSVAVTRVGDPGIFAGYGMFTFGAQTQLLLFVFLTSMTAAGQLVLTKQLGVSRRMLSTPTGVLTIIAGEAAGRLAVALLQAVFIVAITATVFGVSWGDPLAATSIILLFSLVAAAVAMLIGAVSTNAEQASSLGVFAGLVLGALGGCMVPWELMPEVMQNASRAIPHSWAILALKELIRNGGGIDTVATNLLVLAAFAGAILLLAGWRFRRAIAG